MCGEVYLFVGCQGFCVTDCHLLWDLWRQSSAHSYSAGLLLLDWHFAASVCGCGSACFSSVASSPQRQHFEHQRDRDQHLQPPHLTSSAWEPALEFQSLVSSSLLLNKRKKDSTTSVKCLCCIKWCFFFHLWNSLVDPEACSPSLAFFCKVLDTAWTGNAGSGVWISSRQLCRAEADSFPPRDSFLLVRCCCCFVSPCCTPSLWGVNTDFCLLSADPSCLLSLILLLKKIGAIFMSLTLTSSLFFLSAVVLDAYRSCAGSSSDAPELLESDNTITSSIRGWPLIDEAASPRFFLPLSLFRILQIIQLDSLLHFGFGAHTSWSDVHFRQNHRCFTA